MLRFSWIAEVGEFSFAFQNNCRQILDWMVLKGISINKGAYNIAARIWTCEKKMFHLEGSLVLWLMTHADFEWFWHILTQQRATTNNHEQRNAYYWQSNLAITRKCMSWVYHWHCIFPFLSLSHFYTWEAIRAFAEANEPENAEEMFRRRSTSVPVVPIGGEHLQFESWWGWYINTIFTYCILFFY